MARRQAIIDAKRDEMLKCLRPKYARAKELAKPVYMWTVSVKWYTSVDDENGKHRNVFREEQETVAAQNESDAWARFCDKIGEWPSRRDWKPTITKGKRLSAEAVEAALDEDGSDEDREIPTVSFGSLSRKKK